MPPDASVDDAMRARSCVDQQTYGTGTYAPPAARRSSPVPPLADVGR
jgi:hypothetical protein